jgi:hypothetical protein
LLVLRERSQGLIFQVDFNVAKSLLGCIPVELILLVDYVDLEEAIEVNHFGLKNFWEV